MKTLVCIEPGKFEYQLIDKPIATISKVLLKIRRIGICGTDLHAFEGTQPYFTYPKILGHELAGEIVEGDLPAGFHVGDQVTFIPYFPCGHCVACRNNQPNCCVNIQGCGVHIHGGMVEYLNVPSYSLIKGHGIPLDHLALVEPMAIGAHAVKRANIKPGEFVLVIGAGPIGLGIMELALISGGRVIAMDINQNRLNFCRDILNVEYTINAMENPREVIHSITGGDWARVVIDATGSARAIQEGFQYMAHGSRYVLVGLQKGDISFNHPEFHKRESILMSSRNALKEDFEWITALMRQGKLQTAKYITHRVGFDNLKDEFHSWLDPSNGVIKAMVELD